MGGERRSYQNEKSLFFWRALTSLSVSLYSLSQILTLQKTVDARGSLGARRTSEDAADGKRKREKKRRKERIESKQTIDAHSLSSSTSSSFLPSYLSVSLPFQTPTRSSPPRPSPALSCDQH